MYKICVQHVVSLWDVWVDFCVYLSTVFQNFYSTVCRLVAYPLFPQLQPAGLYATEKQNLTGVILKFYTQSTTTIITNKNK